MKQLLSLRLLVIFILAAGTAQAKIWRVNNTPGVNADFTTLTAAVASASVLSGDTIHVEPSSTQYAGATITKNLVIIGNGYLLTGAGGNSGLQENTLNSSITGLVFGPGSAGTRILGMTISSNFMSFNAGYSGNVNLTFEKCQLTWPLSVTAGSTYNNISLRKCFFTNGLNLTTTAIFNNFIMENCILNSNVFWFNPSLSGTGNIIRNNTIKVGGNIELSGFYVANNIFISAQNNIFLNCNVKNNVFSFNQTGVITGPLSTNGNNLVAQSEASLIVNTGSDDGRFQLTASSPAIGGGVDIGGTKPNCGAFGGNDPYRLSGIPGIPTIYSLTVPASIPLGAPTMNVTFSTRNNN